MSLYAAGQKLKPPLSQLFKECFVLLRVSLNVLTSLKFVAKPGEGLHPVFKGLFITFTGLLLFYEAPLGHRKRQVGNSIKDFQAFDIVVSG
jgi:hypothetical protein